MLLSSHLRTRSYLIALVRGLIIQSTFGLDSIDGTLVAHHTMTLLLIGRYWWIRSWFVHAAVWNDALHLHHCVKLLSCLLKLFLIGRVVRIWTHCTHRVSTGLLADHVSKSAYDASLVFNFDMDRVVWIDWAAIGHWTLGTSSTLDTSLSSDTTHLASRLQNLLTTASTSVHRVVHHSSFVQRTVRLPVERISLIVLPINTLMGATRSL